LRLVALLRLAVRLNRGRSQEAPPAFRLRAQDATLELELPERWLDVNPLTTADLAEEATMLRQAGLRLRYR
jgi:exopolyphosphatase/guanosine-5'-triphosphate,3'-diphosphate pyrophosphatase